MGKNGTDIQPILDAITSSKSSVPLDISADLDIERARIISELKSDFDKERRAIISALKSDFDSERATIINAIKADFDVERAAIVSAFQSDLDAERAVIVSAIASKRIVPVKTVFWGEADLSLNRSSRQGRKIAESPGAYYCVFGVATSNGAKSQVADFRFQNSASTPSSFVELSGVNQELPLSNISQARYIYEGTIIGDELWYQTYNNNSGSFGAAGFAVFWGELG